ncbi:adenylosuccinate lyase family protein [Methylolobus aquaticus]|nr:adenylosuccinate lyase family protein [Methylolobus aquaticus]
MSVHIMDSAIFGNSWATPEMRALFEERSVVAGWIEVLSALAATEAEYGLIPQRAADALCEACPQIKLDDPFFAEVRRGFEQTNHSLLGLIHALQRRCPGDSGEWLCYGATVQDITDTHNARVLKRAHGLMRERLDGLVGVLAGLAARHRTTPQCGRTHGQPGLPITFGYKVAGWLDELLRHRQRIVEISPRLAVGQLAGGVGSLSSFGPQGLVVQRRFLERLELAVPAISWTASRDRLAEWLNLLTLLSALGDRIGHEIYNLQRPEIGELREASAAGVVGSITMPQKRNPEISEHLGTLARQVRHAAAQMGENLVHDHERDGRAWKAEWAIVPVACLAADKALALLHDALMHLEVDESRMLHNLEATQGAVHAERVMLALAPQLGKQSAHALIHRLASEAGSRGVPFRDAFENSEEIRAQLGDEALRTLLGAPIDTGQCAEMVDRVLRSVGSGSNQ